MKTDTSPLTADDQDQIIALIKKLSENDILKKNTNRSKGFSNKKYILKYKNVIKKSHAEGQTIRNIYKGLMSFENHDLTIRTFYRLCQLYVFSEPSISSRTKELEATDKTAKNATENNPEPNSTDTEKEPNKDFDLSIHENNGINKKFNHSSTPDLHKILHG